MEEIKIPVRKEVKVEIEKHPEINWAEVFGKAAVKTLHKLAVLKFMEEKLSKSGFTEEDAIRLSDEIKQSRLRELKEKGLI